MLFGDRTVPGRFNQFQLTEGINHTHQPWFTFHQFHLTFLFQNTPFKIRQTSGNARLFTFILILTHKFKHHTRVIVSVDDEFYLIVIVINITWTKCLCGDLSSCCISSGASETVVMPRSSSLILSYVSQRDKRMWKVIKKEHIRGCTVKYCVCWCHN